jgi:hypothetical protein
VVILSLPNAAIVELAAFGAEGAATGDAPVLVIDMSSIDPGATRRLAAGPPTPGTPGWIPPCRVALRPPWPGR